VADLADLAAPASLADRPALVLDLPVVELPVAALGLCLGEAVERALDPAAVVVHLPALVAMAAQDLPAVSPGAVGHASVGAALVAGLAAAARGVPAARLASRRAAAQAVAS